MGKGRVRLVHEICCDPLVLLFSIARRSAPHEGMVNFSGQTEWLFHAEDVAQKQHVSNTESIMLSRLQRPCLRPRTYRKAKSANTIVNFT